MRVSARLASPDDLAALAGLRQRARSETAAQRGGSLLLRYGPQCIGGSTASTRAALVAVVEVESVVLGYLEASLLSVEDGGLLCWVDAIYVEAGGREIGAGEALMDLVKRWASENDAEGIDVVALPGARETKNFLESNGFAARLVVMHASVEA
ncbi:MAG: N-acetyltransferase [Acidimicrobiales bacterium]